MHYFNHSWKKDHDAKTGHLLMYVPDQKTRKWMQVGRDIGESGLGLFCTNILHGEAEESDTKIWQG